MKESFSSILLEETNKDEYRTDKNGNIIVEDTQEPVPEEYVGLPPTITEKESSREEVAHDDMAKTVGATAVRPVGYKFSSDTYNIPNVSVINKNADLEARNPDGTYDF